MNPELPERWNALSNLLAESYGAKEALNALNDGIERCPDDAELRVSAARMLETLGEYDTALGYCTQALRLNPNHLGARRLRFTLLAKVGRADAARPHVVDVAGIDPCEPYIFDLLGGYLNDPKAVKELLERCDVALAINPACANAVYYKALALTKLGLLDAAREVMAFDEYVRETIPATPQPYPDQEAFLGALADEILRHPSLTKDPPGKATSGGQQTRVLQEEDGPAIAVLLDMIRRCSDQFAGELDEIAGTFAAGRPPKCSLIAWAVVLGAEGRQQSHVHCDGWLSGVFYVRSPKSEGDGAYRGDLVLGALDEVTEGSAPWRTRHIEPRPGRLVLFPSYTPHATTPSRAEGERISVAFDITP